MLLKNISALTVIHGLNYFFSLVIIPYLLLLYGPENWGKLVFVQTVINYFIWFTDWGFNRGAIKKISERRANSKDTSFLFFNYWLAQFLLLAIALLSFFLLLLSFGPIHGIGNSLFAISSILIISNVIFPAWYFVGLEQVMESAIVQFLPKVLNVVFILFYLKNATNLVDYIIIISLTSFFVSIAGLVFMFKLNRISFTKPRLKESILILKEDFVWFRVNMISSLSGLLIPTYLGISGELSQLAFFNIVDRIKSAAIIILHPISHSLFPRMNFLFRTSINEALFVAKRSFLVLTFLSGLSSVFIFIFSKEILFFFGGANFIHASNFLRIIAFIPLISTINCFFLDQIIMPNSSGSLIEKINFFKLMFICFLIYPSFRFFSLDGIGCLLLISEIFIFFLICYKVRNLLNRFKAYKQ